MLDIVQQFLLNLKETSLFEYIAVVMGIISVICSRLENIWVYPTGLVNTIIYIYLSFKGHLIGEASVNFYYTVMSIYGWWLWTRKDRAAQPLLQVTFSSKKEWVQQAIFFLVFYMSIFAALRYLKANFYPGVIPWADAFASATAFTGMWLMAKKKVESWWWWIATNIASIPLYFVKNYVMTSVYYLVLLVLAVLGLIEWQRRAKASQGNTVFTFE